MVAAMHPAPSVASASPASAAKQPRGQMLDHRDRFLAFAFAAADLLVEADPTGRITFAAGAFRSRFGAAPESFVGRRISDLVAPEDGGTLAMAMNLLLARGRLAPLSVRLNDASRSAFALAGLAPLGTGPAARLCLTLGPVPSMPEAAPVASADAFGREAEARLRAAEGVGLEGVLALLELGEDATAALASQPGLAAEVGGALAAGAGNALAGELGPGRYGLLPGSGETPDLPTLAGRIGSVLAAHGVSGKVVTQEVSLSAEGLTAVQAVRALRHALATFAREGAAGMGGRGFGSGLAGCVAKVSSRVAVLRRSIVEQHFDLSFQPIVDLGSREVHHREALIRPHSSVGADFASPQEFVLFAETVGLTEALDLAVTDRVLASAAGSTMPLACNLSGLSVQSPGFRERLLARLDARPDAARHLMVEVTESAEIEEEDEAIATLEALRARGVALCIDDFGAGAAAFRYLRSFRVDYVKVDGLYVRNAVRNERDRAFVAAMVDLSLAVGAKVIAERIETEEDARVMRSLGVHYGQGYLFGRPGPLPAAARARRRGVADEVWA